jgi:hypothetical protein
MIVYAVVDQTISPTSPLGDAIDVFLRREDAQRFIEEIEGDDPELAEALRIEERELGAGSAAPAQQLSQLGAASKRNRLGYTCFPLL